MEPKNWPNCVWKMDTRRQERRGINAVANIIETDWQCGWQEYDSHNDDGVDGVIIMRRGNTRPVDTGGIVFAQVKCGESYRREQRQHPESICVSLGTEYLRKHMLLWRKMSGPAVLVYVDDPASRANPRCWWVRLTEDCIAPTNSGIVLIPKAQRFGHHAKGPFLQLCGSRNSDQQLPEIRMSSDDLLPVSFGGELTLRQSAWQYYKKWRDENPRLHPNLDRVIVNRVGWKHITRRGRSIHRIVNSCLLLPVARQMIETGLPVTFLGRAKRHTSEDCERIVDYLGIRASVVFPHRQSSIVQVVLMRERLYQPHARTKVWFYSVYERRRGT